MANRRTPKTASKAARPVVEVPRRSIKVFFIMAFAAMGAMFALGVFVGRGTSPIRFDIQNIHEELARLKEAVLAAEAGKAEEVEVIHDPDDVDIHGMLKDPADDLLMPPEAPPPEEAAAPPALEAPEAPAPEASPTEDAGEPRLETWWCVQVEAVNVEKDAMRLVDKWRKIGYRAYVVEHKRPGRESLYRVRIGRFTVKKDAVDELEKIREKKPDAFISRQSATRKTT